MIANFYLTHTLIVLAALGAALCAVPESLGRPFKRWFLLLPGVLAALSALVLVAYPEISQLWRPQLWLIGFVAGLAGVVRGRFIDMDCDQDVNLVLVRRGQDSLGGAILMLLFAMIEIGIELRSPDNVRFEPTMELGMTLVAGFLLGRGIMAFVQAGDADHTDLRGP